MRAPWKKIFIARYILYLEILGFAVMGVIIAGMIFCVVYEIDDTARMKAEDIPLTIEPVSLASRCYVQSVNVKDKETVAKGQPLLTVLDQPDDVALMTARLNLRETIEALASASRTITMSPEAIESVRAALAALKTATPVHPPGTIAAPVSGIVVAPNLQGLTDTIKQGYVCNIHNSDVLRFEARVSGKNLDRVHISLLGTRDILNWKEMTKALKSIEPPSSKPVERFWKLANKNDPSFKERLRFIEGGRTPDDTGKGDVTAVLNNVLRLSELYSDTVWPVSSLNSEAKALVEKGVAGLGENDLFRLNRLLLENTFPEWIEKSPNQRQFVRAKILVPRPPILVKGVEKRQKPVVVPMTGEVVSDKSVWPNFLDGSYGVTIDLPNPPPVVRDYLNKRLTDPNLAKVGMTGSIVVGKIPIFRFLFSKS